MFACSCVQNASVLEKCLLFIHTLTAIVNIKFLTGLHPVSTGEPITLIHACETPCIQFSPAINELRLFLPVLIAVVDGIDRHGAELFAVADKRLRHEDVLLTTAEAKHLHHGVDLRLKHFRQLHTNDTRQVIYNADKFLPAIEWVEN